MGEGGVPVGGGALGLKAEGLSGRKNAGGEKGVVTREPLLGAQPGWLVDQISGVPASQRASGESCMQSGMDQERASE
jgi:hypothetical protein